MTRQPMQLLRGVRHAVLAVADQLSPSGFVPLPAGLRPESVALVSVYRRHNASVLRRLLDALPPSAEVRLWALDDIDPALERLTIGQGPGGRLALLNRLVAALPAEPEVLVIADDDVEVVCGDLERLIRVGRALGYDLFQPSHSSRSATAFKHFSRKRLRFVARTTSFVEQGPLVLLSRSAQRCLLPLPGDLGMGWGIEARWSRTAEAEGLQLGVIDAVTIRHFSGSRHPYDTKKELAQLRREVRAAGLSDLRDLQRASHGIGPARAWRAVRRTSAPETLTQPGEVAAESAHAVAPGVARYSVR